VPVNRSKPLRVAILGAGLIGIDLLTKVKCSAVLDCQLVVGRNPGAHGLRRAASLGYATAADGIRSLVAADQPFDVVFDASNANSHAERWERLEPSGTMLVDLTPSMVGHMVAPTVNGTDALSHRNISLVSCGGQAAIPILHALTRRIPAYYIEVVTTAASLSVGRATRLNLDEYIEATQGAVRAFTGVQDVKVMVNLSPARPPATFRVAMSLLAPGLDIEPVRAAVAAAAEDVRAFVPGFAVKACTVTDERAFVAIEVTAAGDRIPRYAGNLDIINSAAIFVAEQYAMSPASFATAELP
jgi:acetaldehyde dehydrogenase